MNSRHLIAEEKGDPTRIMVRRALSEPKTAKAGVMLDSSFARFRPSTATFSEERTPSRHFGRWELSAMVETQSSCKKAVRRGDYGERIRALVGVSSHLVIARLV